MPNFNMYPKDKKSPRRPEVRPANVVIRVLPLLLCLVAAVVFWSYSMGNSRPAPEPETTVAETTAAEETADTPEEVTTDGVPAESLPSESEAQPSDL